jgi:hypothetical protein
MKFELDSSELLSGATLGVLAGFLSHSSSQRWIRLGRDAYLAHYAQLFDRRLAHPPGLIPTLILSVLMVLAAIAVFKAVAFLYRKILSVLPRKAAMRSES